MLNKNIHTFIACDAEYADADIVIFGAPFDSTTSYRPGTRFGPGAIRDNSYGLETYSPYLNHDLTKIKVFDSGDLELCFGSAESALQDIEARTRTIIADGKRPLLFGGEHLVSLGAIRAMAQAYPNLRIIHLDAHADLRDDYLGAKLSHACVLRRAWDILGDGRIYQLGIRSGDASEFTFAAEHTRMHCFDLSACAQYLDEIGSHPVYFTLDLDVLDPGIFPGTGTPEAGGISFQDLMQAFNLIFPRADVRGCDLVELSPPYDSSGISTACAGKIARELMLNWSLNLK